MPGAPQLTLEIKDYVAMPITGTLDGTGQTDGMLARVNSLREEPGGADRFFVNDLNGPLYILDKNDEDASRRISTSTAATGARALPQARLRSRLRQRPDQLSVRSRLPRATGSFYTVHIEDPALAGVEPFRTTRTLPGLNVRGYATTPADRDARRDPARRRR